MRETQKETRIVLEESTEVPSCGIENLHEDQSQRELLRKTKRGQRFISVPFLVSPGSLIRLRWFSNVLDCYFKSKHVAKEIQTVHNHIGPAAIQATAASTTCGEQDHQGARNESYSLHKNVSQTITSQAR